MNKPLTRTLPKTDLDLTDDQFAGLRHNLASHPTAWFYLQAQPDVGNYILARMGLVAWPITLVMAVISSLFSGALPRLSDVFSVILYPLIEICLILIIVGKKNKWILLLLCHILILMSFIMAWTAVLEGYNFMVG